MGNTKRKRAIVAALTDFSHDGLREFGAPPMPAILIARVIGESEKLSSVCQSLKKLTEEGVLIAEHRYQEARFSRNGTSGFQIRKCIVYWNAATIEEDRRRADLTRFLFGVKIEGQLFVVIELQLIQ